MTVLLEYIAMTALLEYLKNWAIKSLLSSPANVAITFSGKQSHSIVDGTVILYSLSLSNNHAYTTGWCLILVLVIAY